jgi:sirohydrochlorin cobaltochelatase
MKSIITRAIMAFIVPAVLLSGCTTSQKAAASEKPVIVIAAFGSSYETGQSNLEDFDKAVREAFPENEVTWGFTASFIVEKLRDAGRETLFASEVPVRTISETITDLAAEGKTNLVVVNFLLMVGGEYREVLDVPTPGQNVKYVRPLLYYPENAQDVITALKGEFGKEGEATVFCAHGNEKHPQYNTELIDIAHVLQADYDNAYLALMEGEPSFGSVKEEILASGVKGVKFVTFMLTFGDHMSNDVMGDEESFKAELGLPAEVSNGLASLPTVQQLFLERIETALEQF